MSAEEQLRTDDAARERLVGSDVADGVQDPGTDAVIETSDSADRAETPTAERDTALAGAAQTADGARADVASGGNTGPAAEDDVAGHDESASSDEAAAADEGDSADGEDSEDEEDSDDAGDPQGGSGAPRGTGRVKKTLSRERTEQLEREGEIAADFLERLLDIADMDGDIDVDIDGERAAVAIVDSEDGRVPRRLVGQDGKVLEALQELARLAVQAETGERSRLMLDVAGHRAGRRRVVIGEAREAIAEVEAGAERVEMKPMTAFERKVVHDEILAAGLVSESDGVEPGRFVVVYPA